jgi:hypothetical protein
MRLVCEKDKNVSAKDKCPMTTNHVESEVTAELYRQ